MTFWNAVPEGWPDEEWPVAAEVPTKFWTGLPSEWPEEGATFIGPVEGDPVGQWYAIEYTEDGPLTTFYGSGDNFCERYFNARLTRRTRLRSWLRRHLGR